MKKPSLLLILFVSLVAAANNSYYYFSVINGENGLSHNQVKAILQDSYGFMWFGTVNRLNRYDGVSMKVFDCFDPDQQRGNNNISALFEDPNRTLWVGTDEGVFLYQPQSESFRFFDKTTDDGVMPISWVADIQMDMDDNIWIVMPSQALFRYNQREDRLYSYSVVENFKPGVSTPTCISIERNGRVWVGSYSSGVYLYNKSSDSFIQYLGDGDNTQATLTDKHIYSMCHAGEQLYIGVHEEDLLKLNKRKNSIEVVDYPGVSHSIIRHINLVNNEDIWVSTQSGVFIIQTNEPTYSNIQADPINSYSLSDNYVNKTYQDKEGGIWIATYFGGLNFLPSNHNRFEIYTPQSDDKSIKSRRSRVLKEDSDGNIWIGSEDAGVSRFNPTTMEFTHIKESEGKNTLSLLATKEYIYAGYFKQNIDLIDQQTLRITHHDEKTLGINESSIYALCEDRYGNIWLGNAWHIYLRKRGESRFKQMEMFGDYFFFEIIEDSEGYIWAATLGNGVFQYNQEKQTIRHYQVRDSLGLSSDAISSITEDHLGQIWLSTDRGGICVFNKQTGRFTAYATEHGLPDNVAYKIVEDKQYNLWFGTNKGLVKFNPISNETRVFTMSDGLLTDQFNYKAGMRATNGKLYFGTVHGLISFFPENLTTNNYIPPVFITKMSVFNNELTIGEAETPLTQSISHTQQVTLSHKQSNISFEFAALSFTSPQANRYAYKMENVDEEWIYTQESRTASYTNLIPGKYLFKVKASNNDGLWNDTPAFIEIRILPPWWSSPPAIVIYLLLTILILYFTAKHYIRKISQRNKEKQLLFAIEKEKELYESKVSFFTEMAHEIRTPVTLISGPLEAIKEMHIEDKRLTYNLSIIDQNTGHLLTLINQLLDFRKVDSNKLQLSFRKTNINELLKELVPRFEKEALLNNRTIELLLPEGDEVYAYVDRESIVKIVYNLMSNAIKYSEKQIAVRLVINEESFLFQFENDGKEIPTHLREKIFEPFFRIKSYEQDIPGSGIGLSVARSLAELHHGMLYYERIEPLNLFLLTLPIHQTDNIEEEEPIVNKFPETIAIIPEKEEIPEVHTHNKETILIVEDNISLLDFLSGQLCKHYHIIKAMNGKLAMEALMTARVDLVLSDIMMPEMDGFELCERIKSTGELSHILVVLLTAKNDQQSKIQGLKLGADAYVEKPFSFQYLNTLLESLLNNRKRDIELFMQKPFIPIQRGGINKADEQFMNKVVEIIQQNMTEPGFNVEQLAELLLMGRASLHRKLKAIIDMAPVDFIRLVRMQKAAHLIQEKKYRINEVAFMVGINNVSYFAKLFQSQFGMTPKEFEKQYHEETKQKERE